MTDRVPLTAKGVVRLREELERMKTVDRPEIIQAIAEARAQGDLKENAEYHAARERQGLLEARIAQIESALSLAQEIDITAIPHTGRVVFGATVHLEVPADNTTCTWQIVGDLEADIDQGRISVGCPVARKLIGRSESESVVVETPSGSTEYLIRKVEHI